MPARTRYPTRVRIVVLVGLAACGRVGFQERLAGDSGRESDAATDAHADGLLDGALATTITYAGVFATSHPGPGPTDSFIAQAHAAGDVVVMQIGCGTTTTAPTGATVSALGWTFLALDSVQGTADLGTVQLVAIAPDTNPVTLSIAWSGSPCEIGTAVLADEFAGVFTAGGIGNVYSGGVQRSGIGTCSASFTTLVDAETIWAACFSRTAVSGIGPGYQQGANDGGGDMAEYKISTDPSVTMEDPTFGNADEFIEDVIELRPQ